MPDLHLFLYVWTERLGRGHVGVAIGYVAVSALGKGRGRRAPWRPGDQAGWLC